MFHPPPLRLMILALTAAAQACLPPLLFISVLIALTFSHYAMAFYFSRHRLKSLLQRRSTYVPLAALGLMIILTCWFDAPSMLLVFGLHHVFNETYLGERFSVHSTRWAFFSRVVFEVSLYTALIQPELLIATKGFATATLISGALAASLLNLMAVKKLSRNELLFSGGGALIGFLCLSANLGGLDFVLYYHFTYWALAPAYQLSQQGARAQMTYAAATLVPIAAIFLFTPAAFHFGQTSLDDLSRLTRIGGYFHIFSSFALSSAHPRFVRRWFELPVATSSENISHEAA